MDRDGRRTQAGRRRRCSGRRGRGGRGSNRRCWRSLGGGRSRPSLGFSRRACRGRGSFCSLTLSRLTSRRLSGLALTLGLSLGLALPLGSVFHLALQQRSL